MKDASSAIPAPVESGPYHFKYETVKGYFKQSEEETDDRGFDFIEEEFGLIERTYHEKGEDKRHEDKGQWQAFEDHVSDLNEQAERGVHYKVLFLGRHGQGYHNVAETKYGTEAWDCYWSLLDGADGLVWDDAHLTDMGQDQARDVNGLWKKLLPKGIPAPETFYVSPLTRTLQTADLSFHGLGWPEDRPYKPFVKELVREALGVHTCDRRSNASHITKAFPHITLENNFSEPDPLWESDYREPRSARKYRLETFLDDVFENDRGKFLSFTSHSGAIASILEGVGHRTFALQTGGVIPVFVKAERVDGERVKPPKEPSEGPEPCEEPPTPAEGLGT
ncbi:phosphoglycerate mutase-like protein [Amniculicola lignicola CBS 123094]|uniref:Phosphoglycerate mutase-like protein n=1 Tax=Amniculicola lignicola CBS 123094 TaxID=1392246 RepID=A0A6A5WW70_9PLEO|nr:phosphoglycerate mutase-like protein [Amniculicola lignicola CBS 123094]